MIRRLVAGLLPTAAVHGQAADTMKQVLDRALAHGAAPASFLWLAGQHGL